jgi:hypothetical protein
MSELYLSQSPYCDDCKRDANECLVEVEVDGEYKMWKDKCRFSDEYGQAPDCEECDADYGKCECTEICRDDDDEFKCESCSTVQGLNNCELCNMENVCEECYGQGGDYGPNEIWVCNECLPICLKCKSKLSTADDACCGKGRSDLSKSEVGTN